MARKPRAKAVSGTYHIMLRGVNRQRIFERGYDYIHFMEILQQVMHTLPDRSLSLEPTFQLYAYCLMENHVHLLIHETTCDTSLIVKRIENAYVRYFNDQHERVGHLFQDRFRSEAVDDSQYLIRLYKYIHANPYHGGRCKHPMNYQWCSYKELAGGKVKFPICSSPEPVFGIPAIIDFDTTEYQDVAVSEAHEEKLNAHTIEHRLLELTNCRTISEFQQLDKRSQRHAIAILKEEGASHRMLNRVTGLTLGVIRYAKTNEEFASTDNANILPND